MIPGVATAPLDPNKPTGVIMIADPKVPPPPPTTSGGANPIPIGAPVNPNS